MPDALEDSLQIDWLGGNCPVQAEGRVGGKLFYFRARGDAWTMDIGGADPCTGPEWSYGEDYGAWPEAGYMPEDEARSFIRKTAERYLSGELPDPEFMVDHCWMGRLAWRALPRGHWLSARRWNYWIEVLRVQARRRRIHSAQSEQA